eukprot:TRINITY_DN3492_c0_g1_i2.p1 TRINITY_DN3492_c0_g1~~TRINITY_DN3492_c0_g1_i2.p1  ORF type:complete len:170 (-),score=3.86 TRINITY_DN3492_c0_g1_i2:672-1181(-)
MQNVLDKGPWPFDNRPLILKPWTPATVLETDRISKFPIWVKLPCFKLHLWSVKILSKIASVIGKRICTDGITASQGRLSYARFCVEISPDFELPSFMTLKDPKGETLERKIEYEWTPAKCAYCRCFGHKTEHCKRKPVPIWKPVLASSSKQAKIQENKVNTPNNHRMFH